ncbi:hypothetical protein Q9Q94_11940 [Uliginosibacterium sp. 31-16]|uniref:hypothetical protein n=1 Tax=Uliginosibacterium sp. 31-16 TaxID=3068315 RepID=UPI00274007A5|nr:hypothetical protein [Uliginosibacterium sp. 31-16]MDP5240243.1 hypothetical protein [Uliginosibacterium sp. 31-16]
MAKFLSAFLLLAVLPAAAQTGPFFDPTRPPASVLAPQAEVTSPQEAPLLLQSVLLSPQRQVAVISGQSVLVGQAIRGYRLRMLTNRQAELQGPQGRLTLWLIAPLDSNPSPAVAKVPPSQGDRK